MFVSRQIRRGQRLRLVIGPSNTIYSQRNFNAGGPVSAESIQDARVVTVKLFHDPLRPSVLYVPIGRSQDANEPLAPAAAFIRPDTSE
jgi:uncharacterized protein